MLNSRDNLSFRASGREVRSSNKVSFTLSRRYYWKLGTQPKSPLSSGSNKDFLPLPDVNESQEGEPGIFLQNEDNSGAPPSLVTIMSECAANGHNLITKGYKGTHSVLEVNLVLGTIFGLDARPCPCSLEAGLHIGYFCFASKFT